MRSFILEKKAVEQGRYPAGQVPGPPVDEQERGSQGCRGVTAGVGAWKAPVDCALPVEVEVDDDPDEAGAGVVVVTDATGELTENCVPVTTVTWAPPVVGPSAVMTAPDNDLATAWAAACSVRVLWAK